MPRLKPEVIKEREDFLRDLFKTSGETTISDANEKLKTKYGFKMSPNRVLDIRHEVTGKGKNGTHKRGPGRPRGSKNAGKTSPTSEVRARSGAAGGPLGNFVVVTCDTPESRTALEASIATIVGLGGKVGIDAKATEALAALAALRSTAA